MVSKQLPRILVRISGYLILGLAIPMQVLAGPNPFYGSVSAMSGVSDNALKAEQDTISEKQQQYALNLGGKWDNSLLAFNMQYDASKQTFSEDSQEEKTLLDGNSSLLLGRGNQPASLFLVHSRSTLLSAPDSLNLTQNQDEKDVFSARPTLRQRITGVDSLLLNGEFTRINYRENELKNSRREGGSVIFDHKFSPLDELQLSLQQTSIDFEHSPGANYSLSTASLNYNVRLRKLSYSVKVGANKSSPDVGEDYSGPYHEFDVKFNSGSQIFSLNGGRQLTDTSAGGGDVLPESELPTSDGGVASLDQIERTRYGISWSTIALCQGCSFLVGATQINDDYLNLNASAKSQVWNVEFSYAFSLAAKIALRFAAGDNTYTQIIIGEDYKIYNSRLEYTYQIARDLGLNFLLNKERRDSLAANNNYTENYVAAGLTYKF